MSKFTDYATAIEGGAPTAKFKHELIDQAGNVLATTEPVEAGSDVIHWGATMSPLSSQSNRVSQRTATLRVPLSDPDLMPNPGRILHPDYGSRVQTSAGVIVNGEEEYVVQSTLAVDEVSGTNVSGVTTLDVELVDALAPVRSELVDAFAFAADEPVKDVVERLMLQVLDVDSFRIAETDGCVVPRGSFGIGTSRYDMINQFLEGCGQELTATAQGLVISREIPASWDDTSRARWSYGPDGIPFNDADRVWRSRVPQAWQVEGGSFQSVSTATTLVVYDTDPASEGYFRNDGNPTLGSSRFPFIEGTAQGYVAGYGQLRRHGSGPGIVAFRAAFNPFIAEGDLIEADFSGLGVAGTFRVLDYVLPPQGGDTMQIVARGVYDPAIGRDPSNDRGEGCLVSVTDTFDRADENLENLEGSPGSPDWTEVGRSWGVVNNQAVQRFAGEWSLAFVNTPLCTSDQSATVEIGYVPAGRYIGPAVRSSGEFDCYAATADQYGSILLEVWRAGQAVDYLGVHDNNAPLDGRSLTVSAVGTTITVSLDSTVVITAQDDRRTGTHVGMLASGGPPNNAPSVNEFTAGVAT